MENIKFESVRQVEDQYSSLIEIFNEILIEYEKLEEIDDDIQELRNTTLDKYDYTLMAEVYTSLGEKETAEQLEEKANECQEIIESLQEKLQGVDVNEHLAKFYEMEIRKENFDIQMKACEKYLEKSQRKRQAEKIKGNLRPASPRRFPNLTRVPSPRFIADSSDEESSSYSTDSSSESSEESKPPTPKETKKGKKAPAKLNLLQVDPKVADLPAHGIVHIPAPPAEVVAPEEKKEEKKKETKKETKVKESKEESKESSALQPLPEITAVPPAPAKGGRKKKA